jgi:hypothetical protein
MIHTVPALKTFLWDFLSKKDIHKLSVTELEKDVEGIFLRQLFPKDKYILSFLFHDLTTKLDAVQTLGNQATTDRLFDCTMQFLDTILPYETALHKIFKHFEIFPHNYITYLESMEKIGVSIFEKAQIKEIHLNAQDLHVLNLWQIPIPNVVINDGLITVLKGIFIFYVLRFWAFDASHDKEKTMTFLQEALIQLEQFLDLR